MSDTADYATVAIASAAWLTSMYQLIQAANDRRIAVRPHITLTREEGGGSFAIYMENMGLGPAEIVSYTWMASGKPYSKVNREEMAQMLRSVGIRSASIDTFGRWTKGDLFGVGQHYTPILISSYELAPGYEHVVEDNFSALDLVVRYKSLYGQEFIATAAP